MTIEENKMHLAKLLKDEINEYLSGLTIKFRKDLIVAYEKNFCSYEVEGVMIEDYRTYYHDSFQTIIKMISKSLEGGVYSKTSFYKEFSSITGLYTHTTLAKAVIILVNNSLPVKDMVLIDPSEGDDSMDCW